MREIDAIKRLNRDLGDEIAEINKEIETKTEELNATDEQFSKEIDGFKKQIALNTKRMEELDKTIDKLYDDREKLTQNIRQVVYRKYQRILETSPNGRAIAKAEYRKEKDTPAYGLCLGCNMKPAAFRLVSL